LFFWELERFLSPHIIIPISLNLFLFIFFSRTTLTTSFHVSFTFFYDFLSDEGFIFIMTMMMTISTKSLEWKMKINSTFAYKSYYGINTSLLLFLLWRNFPLWW
jgi:hypothetical protein